MKTEALLAHWPKMTPTKFKDVTRAFDSPREFFESGRHTLIERLPWKEEFITSFLLWRDEVDEKKLDTILAQEQIDVITQKDDAYPALLKTIYDPPYCLFVRGTIADIPYPIAVVGTRTCTPYGKHMTQEFVRDLAQHGLTIVSGLALGIDGIAHEETIQSHGKTIAVLGSGINKRHIYPPAHRHLAQRIIDHGGALVSEFPPGTLPSRYTFPRRNRIIAGMSLGTIVMEAAEKSGALITASCALEQGRELFAIPHPITSETGIGPNTLLQQGANLVTSARDIIDMLNLKELETYTQNATIIPDSPIEAAILAHLTREPLHVDEITKRASLTSSEVNSTLTMMEMKGKVRNLGGMMYVLAR